jgi:hypothetical protein
MAFRYLMKEGVCPNPLGAAGIENAVIAHFQRVYLDTSMPQV